MDTNSKEESKFKFWMKRAGLLGFLFFLIKGLMWIGVAVFAGKAIFD
jgi:hypothetical protein